MRVAARILAALAAIPLLAWAVRILSNIWTYNDSGALNYVIFASAPGLPGALLLVFAARGWTSRASRPSQQ